MHRSLLLAPLSLLALAAVACAAQTADRDDPEAAASQYAAALSANDAAAIVDLVNYPGTDLALLDGAIGLDSRAAKGIVAARDGADGVSPSSDDVLFANIAAVDAVPYVGDAAFQKLAAYAAAHPAPKAETVKTVAFAGWESQATVWFVDNASVADLDALLDDRAASALVAHRPYTTVAQIGAQSYVGTAALKTLHAHALDAWKAMRAEPPTLTGTFDGVQFTDETWAESALAIANQATLVQLTSHSITSAPAEAIIAGRTYSTLAQVAAVKGVGQATMQALLFYARSGTFVSPVTGFTLDAASLKAETDLLKEQLVEDEGFAETVVLDDLAAGDKTEASTIMSALSAEIDKLTAPLVGTTYASKDAADAAIDAAAPVKQDTKSGGWTYLQSIGLAKPGSDACIASFDAAVGPHLGSLLFMSESDRPITIVSYPGAGASAPTAASVMALVGAPAGSTATLRDVANFYVDLEPSPDTADAKAVQAAIAGLTDVVYVAIVPPSPNEAEVQVYLVGRNACGDLVGITSISIET